MKKFTKILFIFFLLFVFLSGLFLYWLFNDWKSYYSEKEMNDIAVKVKSVPPLPREFLIIYSKVYPNSVHSSLTHELIDKLVGMGNINGRNHHSCFCDDVFTTDWSLIDRSSGRFQKPDKFRYVKVGYGLQELVGPEACFTYVTRISYEDMKRTNRGYSFTGKELEEFTTDDIIDYIIAEPGPTYYSPLYNPENYMARKMYILNVLEDIILQ